MKELLTELRVALIATISIALIVCGIYPVAVWILAQGLYPVEANGSLVIQRGKIMGSSLIGQGFSNSEYFHPRPSAAGDGYNASSSGGSNLGPISIKLVDVVKRRVLDYRAENRLSPDVLVPVDAITASSSGLDPHISVENAYLQAGRVAKARGLSKNIVFSEIANHTEGRDLGVLGEHRVNVLKLNMALDSIINKDRALLWGGQDR